MKTPKRYVIPFVLALVVSSNDDAMGQTKGKIYASPAEAGRLGRTAKLSALPVAQEAIRIQATVIEVKQELGIEFDFFGGDVKRVKQSGGTVTVVSEAAKDVMIRALLENNAATVISRPQIITANKRSATVQVGRQVAVPDSDHQPPQQQHIGLRLECRPTIMDSRLKLEIECEYSTLGEDNQVRSRHLETATTLNSGDTLMISGVGENGIVVFMTPDILGVAPAKTASKTERKSDAAKVAGDVESAVNRKVLATPPQPSFRLARRVASHQSMDEVMAKLFPKERFETIKLPNAVVLRGTVSEKARARIIEIAEAYYPSVISHLETSEDLAGASDQKTKESTISEQIEALASDVESLRAELRKLIETLELKREDDTVSIDPLVSPNHSTGAGATFANLEPWQLSLADATKIAIQNHKDQSPTKSHERVQRCGEAYRRLRSLQLQLTARQANTLRTDHSQGFQPTVSDALTAFDGSASFGAGGTSPSIGARREQSAALSVVLKIRRAELDLREQMGLTKSDGRLITTTNDKR